MASWLMEAQPYSYIATILTAGTFLLSGLVIELQHLALETESQ